MTLHAHDDEAVIQAALYALNAQSDAERATFEEHLAVCDECRSEVQGLEPAVAAIGALAAEVEPPASLRSTLMARVRGEAAAEEAPSIQPWRAWGAAAPAADMVYVPRDADWEPTAIPGIEARRLRVDTQARRVTMMVRMAPGTSYPAHVHGDDEECYVLAGDLRVGRGLHMKAGDYQLARKGSLHPVQSTDRGCMLLLVSSQHDRLVD